MSSDAESTPVTVRHSAADFTRTPKQLLESSPDGVPLPDLNAARFDFDTRMTKVVAAAIAPLLLQLEESRKRATNATWWMGGGLVVVGVLVVLVGIGQLDTGRQIEGLRRELGATKYDLERRIDDDARRIEDLNRRVERLEKETP